MGIAVELRAKRDQLLRNEPILPRDGAGTRADVGWPNSPASALPPNPSEGDNFRVGASERASGSRDLPGARPPHTSDNGLDAFRSVVVRARVGRIMRERAYRESLRLTDQILGALDDGPLSRTAIGDRCFTYKKRDGIGEVLHTLEAAGFVVSEKIETDGRPVEMWQRSQSLPSGPK